MTKREKELLNAFFEGIAYQKQNQSPLDEETMIRLVRIGVLEALQDINLASRIKKESQKN